MLQPLRLAASSGGDLTDKKHIRLYA